MADMHGFGKMNLEDRGGKHDYEYEDGRQVTATDGLTPSQTIGPFFAYGLTPGPYGYAYSEVHRTDLTGPDITGDTIVIEGQVFDGNGAPVHDALIEIVQADAGGAYATAPRNDGFTGHGRAGTGAGGPGGDTRFEFRTVKPGSTVPGHAPFVTVIVTMRGLLNHFITRAYFADDDHAGDPVLAQVPQERRATLIAALASPGRYRFDIHMQGPNETVFFDL